MSATIKYNGNTIATLSETANKTLLTQGKFCESNIVVENVESGGETLSLTIIGDGTNVLDTSSLDAGVYHGRQITESSSNYDVVGFYLIKQGNLAAFISRNKAGAYRNYVNSSGKVGTNVSTQLFKGSYNIYKVIDVDY